jgi:hypothetical protein
MSQDVFDFRIAKLQRYIRRCHAEGRPVPPAYAAIEHNLDAAHIRAWLTKQDRNVEALKSLMREIAAIPDEEAEPQGMTTEQWLKSEKGPTIHSIEVLQDVLKQLMADGIDPVFIVAALAQVQADFMDEYGVSINQA